MERSDNKPLRLLVSYAEEDKALKIKLIQHLKILQLFGQITIWSADNIAPGSDWRRELDQAVADVDVALLLISAAYLASPFLMNVQLPALLSHRAERGLCIIPILLKTSSWFEHPQLEGLKALPRDGRPLAGYQGDRREQALTQVAHEISELAHSPPPGQPPHGLPPPGPPSPAELPRSSSIPPLPDATFIAGPPIMHPRQFFGREQQLRRIFDLWRKLPMQNAAIIGKNRSGKTSLLLQLASILTTPRAELRPGQRQDYLPGSPRIQFVYVGFQDHRLATRQGLLTYLLSALKIPVPHPCDLDHGLSALATGVQHFTVILLDEMGAMVERCPELDTEFWESLRALATELRGRLAFVLAASRHPHELANRHSLASPFFNIFGYSTELEPLTEPEASDLIGSSPIPFDAADREWITAQSGRWPILLQVLCRERLWTLSEGDRSDHWRQEALRQIPAFAHLLTTS